MVRLPRIEDVKRKVGGRSPVVDMFDWDGCIYDTMKSHGILAATCMQKYFGTPFEDAKRRYHSTTGIPFDKQLEKIYPDASVELRSECATEYHRRKIDEVYYNSSPFKDVHKTLGYLGAIGHVTFVSSSTEATLINSLHERDKIDYYFEDVFGKDEGSKPQHISDVRSRWQPALLVFVGDSKSDVQLTGHGADITIGRAGPVESGMLTPEELVEAGADYATHDLRDMIAIFQ